MEEKGLAVEEVAALTGLSTHTLRYYEREGLIDLIGRAQGGHRRYVKRDVAWIEFLGTSSSSPSATSTAAKA